MGEIPPVVSDTILTPPKNVLNAGNGYLAVKVTNRRGNANVNRIVQASGPGGVYSDKTGADGCAVFVLSIPGTYTVSMMEGSSGYISFNGSSSQTANVDSRQPGHPVVHLRPRRQLHRDPDAARRLQPPADPSGHHLRQLRDPSGRHRVVSVDGGRDDDRRARCGPSCRATRSGPAAARTADPALDPGGRPVAYTPSKGSTTNVRAALQGVSLLTSRLGVPSRRDGHRDLRRARNLHHGRQRARARHQQRTRAAVLLAALRRVDPVGQGRRADGHAPDRRHLRRAWSWPR